MLALSTCWNNHRFSDGMDLAKEIRAMGFEWIEISHGTKVSLLPGLLNAYQQGIIRVTSLHNFCPSPVEVMMDAPDVYEFTSHRAPERDQALSLTKSDHPDGHTIWCGPCGHAHGECSNEIDHQGAREDGS